MKNVYIGEYIKRRRNDLGLTQEQVCEGICAPVTLSRIENGRQAPGRGRINALLQRLGLPDDRYYAIPSQEELEIEALEKEIVGCNVLERVDEGFEKLRQLEKIAAPEDRLTQQFILRSQILLGRLDKRYTVQEQMELLMQAIRLTVPKFDLEDINKCLYTINEVKIINQIANVCSDAEQNKRAADIYYQLLRYVRIHFQETRISIGMLPTILYNYARVLDLCGCYEEGSRYAEEGREACIKYGHYQALPGCLAIYAECCYFLGRNRESEDNYRQAYYLFKTLRKIKNQATVRDEAKRYLGIELND